MFVSSQAMNKIHNVFFVITFSHFKVIPLCKIVQSIEIDITFFHIYISYILKQLFFCYSQIPVKMKKKVKIHILFYSLCHYTDKIIESMDFLLQNCLFLNWYLYEY